MVDATRCNTEIVKNYTRVFTGSNPVLTTKFLKYKNMYNTTNYKEIASLLSQSEELVKILLEQSIFPGMSGDFKVLKDKLAKAQVSSLTTDIISAPSGKDLPLREVGFTLVNSYSYDEASRIQDLFFRVDDTVLTVGMITERPGILIGVGGESFDKALAELKAEFMGDEWGFLDVQLEIVQNQFWIGSYHFEGIGDY